MSARNMAGESTLIVTTRSGVRPLGVRGEPLHNAAAQLRRVIRRRLGDPAADLLADPQVHEDGHAIDWYADGTGEVRRVVDLPSAERIAALAKVDLGLAGIARLGETLAKVGHGEDSGVVGRSLQLAARRPAESFVFLLGDRPVVVCWGYEQEGAATLLPSNLPKVPAPALAAPALIAPTVLPVAAAAPMASIPWFRSLLMALPLLALLLGAAWLMRDRLPAAPDLALATREGPPAPPAPPAPPDPLPLLKASLSEETARAKALQVEMSTIEDELRKRVGECKPEAPPAPKPVPEPPKEAPKPPQVSKAVPPPQAAPPPPPLPPQQPWDGRLRLPRGPTNDYSFLQGCWRSDPFRHEYSQARPGVSSYCFNRSGYGELEWRRGRTACRTRAQAQYDGATLRLRDSDTTCNDGSHWYADQLVCQRGADDVAQCSGNSRGGSFGPTSWSVNMHKIN